MLYYQKHLHTDDGPYSDDSNSTRLDIKPLLVQSILPVSSNLMVIDWAPQASQALRRTCFARVDDYVRYRPV